MPLPPDLTFGVFDAAALETPLPTPTLLTCQVQIRSGKIFASLIDGGSQLNPNNETTRYLTRSTTAGMNCCPNGEVPKPGDVVRLIEYSARRMSGKSEIVFVIPKMVILRHCQGAFAGLQATLPYPYDTAAANLRRSVPDSAPPLLTPSTSTMSGQATSAAAYPTLRPPDRDPSRPASGTPYISDTTSASSAALSTPCSANITPSGQPTAVSASGDTDAVSYGALRKNHGNGTTAGTASRTAPYAQYRQVGAVARRIDGQFIEIKSLTSFLGRWMVKGRFINKGEPRTYSNSRGEGKIWSCDLIDSADPCGTIRCTFFNKAVDKFFPVIKENEIYTVSRGTLKPANRKFNTGSHQFEMQLGEDAQIQWVASDDPAIPVRPRTSVLPIADLAHVPKQTTVSICGILTQVSEVTEIVTRSTGQPRARREISVLDDSGTSIDVTLWGTKASAVSPELLEKQTYPAILVENARVDEYNGRKLSSMAHTDVQLNPDIPEAQRIAQWFGAVERQNIGQFASLTTAAWAGEGKATEHLTIAEIRSRAVEMPERELEDRGCWFTCTATLVNIDRGRQIYWVACPTCGKKVSQQTNEFGDAEYGANNRVQQDESGFCASCSKEVERPIKKYLLNLEIADATGSLRCSAMGEKGLLLMGNVTPDVLVNAQSRGYDPSLYQRYDDYFLQRLRREYAFKIQAKSETYRDETRIRYRIFGIDSLTGVIASDPPGGPNSVGTCQSNLVRDGNRLIEWIYSRLSRAAAA